MPPNTKVFQEFPGEEMAYSDPELIRKTRPMLARPPSECAVFLQTVFQNRHPYMPRFDIKNSTIRTSHKGGSYTAKPEFKP